MADAVELATAYLNLVPSAKGSQGKITEELRGPIEKAGDDSATGFGSRLKATLGGGAVKAGAAAAALGVGMSMMQAFGSAIETADVGAKTTAQLGLNPEQSAAAGSAAGKLYAGAYGESMADVGESVGAVMSSISGMRDASAADIEDITAKAINLSTAFGVDVGESATTAGILIKNGLAGDADSAMDMITASMQKVPASIRGEVLPTMDEYSKHFAALGIDGDTAMGMIVAASNNGQIGMDKMGDAVKEFTIRSTDMSKTTTSAYDALGLNSEEMTNKLLAGGAGANEAMGQIVHGLQEVSNPADQAALSLALFGTPLEDLGTDQIPNFLGMMDPMGDAFDKSAGAADAFGATLNSGPSVQLETFKRQVETAFTSLATQAMPALLAVGAWVQDNSWVIGALAGVVGIALVGAFIAWAASVWAATSALLANPMTWVVIGIMALIAGLILLVANWDAVAAFLSAVWAGIVAWVVSSWQGMISGISDAWNGFTGWLYGVMAGFAGWLGDLWNGISAFAMGVWNGFVGWLSGVISGMVNTFNAQMNGLASFLSGVWNGISSFAQGVWNGLVNFVQGIPASFMAGLSALGNLAATVGGYVSGAKDAAVTKFTELVSWVGGLGAQIVSGIGNVGSLLTDAGSQIIGGFLAGLTASFENVKNFVGGIGQWIADHKGPKAYDLALLVPAGGWIMSGLGAGILAGIPGLGNVLGTVSDFIGSSVQSSAVGLSASGGAYDLEERAGDSGPRVLQKIYPRENMSEETVADIAARKLERAGRG